jgi:hypothetical protein
MIRARRTESSIRMSACDRIIALLKTHPDGLDDDVIAEKLEFSRRQQANARVNTSGFQLRACSGAVWRFLSIPFSFDLARLKSRASASSWRSAP